MPFKILRGFDAVVKKVNFILARAENKDFLSNIV